MHNILIIVDKYGWSYDTIAQGLASYANKDYFNFDIVSEKDDVDYIERHHMNYDLIFAIGWTSVISKKKSDGYRDRLAFLDRKKLITGIHSHRSWDDYLSLPDVLHRPPQELVSKLQHIQGINIISKRLYKIFREAGLQNITLTENGVDTVLFRPITPILTDRRRPLVIGFSGSAEIKKHDDLKGLSTYILPLHDAPNVEVKVLGGRGAQQVERAAMPALYNQIDLYICASTSEGFSQSVLEAAACGRGVMSTKVGGCEDLIEEGRNGCFINRDVDEIKRVVMRLEADRDLVKQWGANNRQVVLERYAWHVQVKQWLAFIRSHLPVAQHHVI